MSDLERDGRDLWRRYRAAASLSPGDPEPDVGLLAAYVDGRLDEDRAAPVDAWLAADPARLALIAPIADAAAAPAPLAVIRNARALVQPVPRPAWRQAVAWASIAASLVIVGASGFIAGHQTDDYGEAITVSVGSELIYGPGGEGDGAAF
jgi:anti-sigma factor RsiW